MRSLNRLLNSQGVPGELHLLQTFQENTLKLLEYKKTTFNLTPFQESLMAFCLGEGKSAYLLQWQLFLSGNLNIFLLKQACKNLIKDNEILRTIFYWNESTSIFQQTILASEESPFAWKVIDLSNVNSSQQESLIKKVIKKDKNKGFMFAKEPLIRFSLFILGDDKYIFLITTHHLIIDGYSGFIIRQKILDYYALDLCPSEKNNEKNMSFYPYVEWLQKQPKEKSSEYWKNLLSSTSPTIISNKYEKTEDGFELWENYFNLSSSTLTLLQEYNITLASYFNSLIGVILAHNVGEKVVSWGNVVSLRPYEVEGIEQIIGPCINTIPLVADFVNNNQSLIEVIKTLQEQITLSREHAYLSMADILKQAPNNKLFNVIFSFQNYQKTAVQVNLPFKVEKTDIQVTSHFPLSIVFEYENKILKACVRYSKKEFDQEFIENFIERIVYLFNTFDIIKNKIVSEISVLLPSENKIIQKINQTSVPYESQKTLIDLIEKQFYQNPTKIAIVSENNEEITYNQLSNSASYIASLLMQNTLSGTIGIFLPRSYKAVASVVGALKAGMSFISLEIDFPIEKIKQICEQASIHYIITDKAHSSLLLSNKNTFQVIVLEDDYLHQKQFFSISALFDSNSLCSLNYTSGSTGIPKLVFTNHQGHVNRLTWLKKNFPLTDDDICILKTKLCFAPAIREIFEPLTQGQKLYVLSESIFQNLDVFLKMIVEKKVTRLFLRPSFIRTVVQSNQINHLLNIKYLEISGEPFPVDMLRVLQKKLPNTNILNRYGATEVASVIYANLTNFNTENWVMRFCPVGFPIQNTCVYVVDEFMKPCAIGVTGEILIGSDCQALGYQDPASTAKAFIHNSFYTSEEPLSSCLFSKPTVFRTGDYGKILPNGMLQYIGRKNRMFKIRGFRVEPAEIELCLEKHHSIHQAIVTLDESNPSNPKIIAFIIASIIDKSINKKELLNFLNYWLPNYMIPADIINIEQVPTTSSGKIDYQTLISLAKQVVGPTNNPTNEIQMKLAMIFQNILGVDNISLDSDFFQMGGNSLLALRLIQEVKKYFSCNILIQDIFENSTIKHLEFFLEKKNNKKNKRKSHIIINNSENTDILYLFPPAGGSPHTYRGFKDFLPKQVKIIAFEAPYLKNDNKYKSIIELSAYYIKEIKEIQKEGPYWIGGWSLGATVAFEVGCQLKQKKNQVHDLLLIDPGFNLQTFTHHEYDRKLTPSNILNIIKTQLETAHIDQNEANKIIERMYQDALLIRDYQPSFYEGNITLIKPTVIGEEERNYQFDDNGLRFFVNGKITVHQLLGNHISMVTNYPHEICNVIKFNWEINK